jgi:hypothetical protein
MAPRSPLAPRAPLAPRSPQLDRRDVLREPNPAGIPSVPTLEELGMAPPAPDLAPDVAAATSPQQKVPFGDAAPSDELGQLAEQLLTGGPQPLGRMNLPLTAAEEAEFNGLVDELLPQDREKMGFGTATDNNNVNVNAKLNPNPATLPAPAPDFSDLPTEVPPTYDEVVAMETAGADPASVESAQLLRAYSRWIDQDADDPAALMKGLTPVMARLAEPLPSAWQNVKRAFVGGAKPVQSPTLRDDVLTPLMAGVRRLSETFVASDPTLPPKEFRQEQLAYLESGMAGALQASMAALSPAQQKRAIARMKDEQNDIWVSLRTSANALGRQHELSKLGASASDFLVETGQMHDILMRAMRRVAAEGPLSKAATAATGG